MIKLNLLSRSLGSFALSFVASAVGYVYFSSELYSGQKTEDVTFPFFTVLAIIFLIVLLKLFIYDLLASTLLKKKPSSKGTIIFYSGYVLALAIDIYAIFMSFQPIYMNLSIFAAILYSPVILIASLVILCGYVFLGKNGKHL